ncbi:MAG: hypothetical protein AAB436_04165 [Patescibacteria group bacterium]
MPEQATHNPQVLDVEGQANQLAAFEDIVSPQAIEAFATRIEDEANTFFYPTEIAEINAAVRSVGDQEAAVRADESISETERDVRLSDVNSRYNELDDRERTVGKHKTFLEERQYEWLNNGRITIKGQEPEATKLVSELQTKAANTETSFIPNESFQALIDRTGPSVLIKSRDNPMEFPLASIVSAQSFESWETGRGPNAIKDGKTSPELIKDYAERSTEIPPVVDATAVILPTGEVVLSSDEAHRVAAAKLKGQETIKIENLKVYRGVPVGQEQNY